MVYQRYTKVPSLLLTLRLEQRAVWEILSQITVKGFTKY